MNLLLQTTQSTLQAKIAVTGSKSETNRVVVIASFVSKHYFGLIRQILTTVK